MFSSRPLATVDAKNAPGEPAWPTSLARLAQMLTQFERWLANGQDDPHRWGLLDQFIREHLAELFDAQQVRCYRLAQGGRGIEPLTDGPRGHAPLTADTGVVAHVLASGQTFVRDQLPLGENLQVLAEQDGNCPAWCFPIVHELRPVGVVAVGSLPSAWAHQESFLEAVANTVSLMWARLQDRDEAALARQTDRLSGVLNRVETLDLAERLLRDAADNYEPVAAIAITVEGLRGLDDAGQWGLRDQVVEQIGRALRRRLRSDDLVGRFADERFVALMRRLDVALGRVIAEKLLAELTSLIGEQMPEGFELVVRGGLAVSGPQQPALGALLTAAFGAATDARTAGKRLCVCTEPLVGPEQG